MSKGTSVANLPGLHNMFGPLDIEMRHRLREVIRNPRKYWSRDHGIILNATDGCLALWQAVRKVDPTFPNVGQTVDIHGTVVKDWERYPTPDLLRKAILYAAPTPAFGPAQNFEVM